MGKVMSQSAREKIRKAALVRCSTPEGVEQLRRAIAAARKALRDAKYKDQLCLLVEAIECA